MAYSDFTLAEIKKRFNLKIDESHNLFAQVGEVEITQFLSELLEENIPLALAIHTEKARSEMLIAPILIELRKAVDHQISLFSGVDFTVDNRQGLNGVCDFIISRSTEQLYVSAPMLMIVEAKNENIKNGLAQCISSMIAAEIFNQNEQNDLSIIYGAVTTGSLWKFLKLENNTAFIDQDEYHIKNIKNVFGILLNIVTSSMPIPA